MLNRLNQNSVYKRYLKHKTSIFFQITDHIYDDLENKSFFIILNSFNFKNDDNRNTATTCIKNINAK